MKTNYRNMTIEARNSVFDVETINCFGCDSIKAAQAAIDRYLDGDKNPQCYGC